MVNMRRSFLLEIFSFREEIIRTINVSRLLIDDKMYKIVGNVEKCIKVNTMK